MAGHGIPNAKRKPDITQASQATKQPAMENDNSINTRNKKNKEWKMVRKREEERKVHMGEGKRYQCNPKNVDLLLLGHSSDPRYTPCFLSWTFFLVFFLPSVISSFLFHGVARHK